MAYNDLRQHLKALEERGCWCAVPKASDQQEHRTSSLVRWQFRSNLPEAERKGFY